MLCYNGWVAKKKGGGFSFVFLWEGVVVVVLEGQKECQKKPS